jgi:hypothetical protein
MYNFGWGILFCTCLAALALTAPVVPRQQLLFESQLSLPNGERVAIFLPSIPVALGLQSKSGERILTIGELLNCQPFDEEVHAFRKSANGELEPFTSHTELLNCGPPSPGGIDRIFVVVGMQWRTR